jgi:DNA ligase (NAD+)
MSKIHQRILKLRKEIEEHQYLYYIKNSPIISDREFDSLFEELIQLEEKNPEFKDPNSPTNRVGSDLNNQFEKSTHKIPVLSLENTYNEQELIDWAMKTSPEELYSLEWKIDGASIVLTYSNGKFEKAVTRGSGGVGDNVTENIRTIRSIPLILKEDVSLVLRGEVYMRFSDFENFNSENSNRYANPRNLVSGTIKQKNSNSVAKRPLRIFVYDAYFENLKFKSHSEIIEKLNQLNFPVLSEISFKKPKDFYSEIQKFKKKKESLDFPTDGMVIKLNSLSLRESLGSTSHSPRWARALKFEATLKETIILDIDFAIGRTGKITPRARVQPVELLGTTVTYATLHNQDFINEKKIGRNAKVLIAKRGEIIPAVEEVIEESSEGVFVLPKKCPSCNTKLVNVDDSVDLFCLNEKCDSRVINSLIFFCERKQMDIEGLGEKQMINFYEKGIIRSFIDIYDLHLKKSSLIEIDGLGKKSVENILKGIEKSKEKDLSKLLPSLGFSEVGHKVTELLIENGFNNIDTLIDLSTKENAKEDLLSIHGLGERTVASILKHFTNPQVIDLINELKKRGLNFNAFKKITSENLIFENQSWCITGSFKNFQPREKAIELIQYLGGKSVSSVTSKTSFLLAGENGGSKYDKAISLKIPIITEEEFVSLLKNNNIQI